MDTAEDTAEAEHVEFYVAKSRESMRKKPSRKRSCLTPD